MKWIVVIGLVIIGVLSQDDILERIPNLPDLDVNDLERTAVENYTKDALTVLKQKCSNTTGGDKVYTELETKAKNLQTFITDNINITVVMTELEEAKKTGSMDEVFAKYCQRKPEAMERLKDITDTFKQCLLEDEKKSIDAKLNLTESMVHFLCEKDGDKIAMFIANGGEECLTSKTEGLQVCFNKSSSVMPSDKWQSMSLLDIDQKVCEEFPELEKCVVNVLEECRIKTPANIIGAMFRYLRKNMACAPQKQPVVADDGRSFTDYLINNRVKRNPDIYAVKSRIQMKCEKNSHDPRAYDRLSHSLRYFLANFSANLLEKSNTCSYIIGDTHIHLEAFLADLNACMSSSEDFVPTFVRNAVDAVFDYLCENNGEKLRQYRSATGLQCMLKSDVRTFEECARPTTANPTDDGEVVLKKSKFCSDIGHIRDCIKAKLLPPCSQDARFAYISEQLLEKIHDKCSGCTIFLNSFLFFGLILFYLQKYL